jgi:hypothetical protein
VQWFYLQYPEYKVCASMNGAFLHGTRQQRRIRMKRLKDQGVLPGFPDLIILVPRRGFHGLTIEMKDQGKTKSALSKEQKAMIQYLTWMGYKAEMCAGVQQAIDLTTWYMGE